MDVKMPLFVVVDSTIRSALILFLAIYAIKFRCWVMFVLIGISSLTLYSVIFKDVDPEGLWITMVEQIMAFLIVYMLYEFMRMRHAIKSLPTPEELDITKQGAMDVASSKKINQPNTRDPQLATRGRADYEDTTKS